MTRRLPGGIRPATMITAAAGLVLAIIAVAVLTAGTGGSRPASDPVASAFTANQVIDPAKKLSLAQFAGRPVIINFFGSWCTPCRQETPLLAKFYSDHGGRVLIIGIDVSDPVAAATKFLHENDVSYPVGADPDLSIAAAYGAESAFPQTFFLNARHRIVRHVFGPLTIGELDSWAARVSRGTGRNGAT